MRKLCFATTLVLVMAACGGGDGGGASASIASSTTATVGATTTAPSTTTTAEPTTTTEATTTTVESGPRFAISSISFGSTSPMLVITNIGTESGDLGGHWLCQRPNYVGIPSVELAPDESVAISLGGSVFLPPPGATTIDQTLLVGGLDPTSGEIGLYSARAFGDAGSIVDYVEWGKAGHGRTGVAVLAGIWPSGGFVETTEDTLAIFAGALPTAGPSDWSS